MISKKQYNDIQEREKQKKIEQLEKYVKTLTESVDAILSQGRTEIYFTELNGGYIFRKG
jgi:thiamine pyrophosphokinase